jgi:GWxTD domain-containing protein
VVYPSYQSNLILDSATYFLSDSLNFGKNTELVFDFNVKVKFSQNYLLEVQLSDLFAGTSTLFPQKIIKETSNGSQSFLPANQNNAVIFEDWISSQANFRLTANNDSINQLFVRYYNRDFSIAPPPFSAANPEIYDYKADDIFTIKFENRKTVSLNLPNEGFYHFQSDTTQKHGLTLFRFYDGYPQVTETAQLVPPLRYLTTNKEFKQLSTSANQKMAVDSFWISSAGNEERALKIFKQYYSRVEMANRLFTSFKEGWKTDRGMIYIIFGQPKTVYRRDDIETWVYGEQGNRVSLTFDFIKAINPFTENDYILQRQTDYKTPWFIAVDYWRR